MINIILYYNNKNNNIRIPFYTLISDTLISLNTGYFPGIYDRLPVSLPLSASHILVGACNQYRLLWLWQRRHHECLPCGIGKGSISPSRWPAQIANTKSECMPYTNLCAWRN